MYMVAKSTIPGLAVLVACFNIVLGRCEGVKEFVSVCVCVCEDEV